MRQLNIYLISGAGADRRLFRKLQFPDSYNIIYIDWITPLNKETIASYAGRLCSVIDNSKPFFLIGLSFGGMVASEISEILKPLFTIIISSASSSAEIPFYYKLAGRLNLPSLMPFAAFKKPSCFSNWALGAKTAEEKLLLKEVLADTDEKFLRWALMAITTWKKPAESKKVFHIHGTSDKVLPIHFVNADLIIPGGEHLLVYSEAELLSNILIKKLEEYSN